MNICFDIYEEIFYTQKTKRIKTDIHDAQAIHQYETGHSMLIVP